MLNISELGIRELDHRKGDGIEVKLLWNSRTDQVTIAVEDEHSGEAWVLDVPGANARDAFNHPYAYAFRRNPTGALAA